MAEKLQNWYPSQQQIKDPQSLERTLRRILDMHYSSVNEVNDMRKVKENKPEAPASESTGQGWNTMMLGLRVEPADPATLANGATLKYVAATKTFKFS